MFLKGKLIIVSVLPVNRTNKIIASADHIILTDIPVAGLTFLRAVLSKTGASPQKNIVSPIYIHSIFFSVYFIRATPVTIKIIAMSFFTYEDFKRRLEVVFENDNTKSVFTTFKLIEVLQKIT